MLRFVPKYSFVKCVLKIIAGLVAQPVMSATDKLGHRDLLVRGLSATDPRPRQWICVCTMPKEVGMLL